MRLLRLALIALPLLPACATSTDPIDVATGDYEQAWAAVRPILEEHCARCHSTNRLSTYRLLETQEQVTLLRASILEKTSPSPFRGLRMPVAANHVDEAGCTPEHPQLNEKRIPDADLELLQAFLERTDHRDFIDSFEPISAPPVEPLSNALSYSSSPFEVLNDGFLTPPEGIPDEYMHEYGYDQRDFDQMEDDWFCIQFDPLRTGPGFLTGVQIETEIGQIFLNSQLVIDTSGGSETARAAAEERGPDWYRCDAGLGFQDEIPLWRTAPGGEAIELPEGTGLRFEPGWRFVLRVDFHTHYDAAEFERLDQNGVIDRDAGTMTWFEQATLRARWAEPAEIERELRWLRVQPSTPAERQAFAVPPGRHSARYSAALPPEDDGSYAVFSAEVEMGGLGQRATLRETAADSCVANNSDFSPKFIEQAIYAEGAAPLLDSGSTLELECAWENPGSEPVGWGPEGEAAVWGRAERCSAVVFYYPTE